MATQHTLTKADIEQFIRAILNDLTHSGHTAVQNWRNDMPQDKAAAANHLFARYSIVIDALDHDYEAAPE